MKGYTLNKHILLKQREKLKELQSAINFIEDKAHQALLIAISDPMEKDVLVNVIVGLIS